MTFEEFAVRAAGPEAGTDFTPYPFQRRLAEEGMPELLEAPTGAGKTMAAVLPWLYRRREHPDGAVRAQTPHWLILALPLRTLVDQAGDQVAGWLANLGFSDQVGLHVLMGGRKGADDWRRTPGRDAILIGSVDMLLSRALNRGYAVGRGVWLIDFGMVNGGAQWVFDEVQLLGPALPTSRQLQAFRDRMGTLLPTRTMWMSATVEESWLRTVDNPTVASTHRIEKADRAAEPLASRLAATKSIASLAVEGSKPTAKDLAAAIIPGHRTGTRTLVFVNTVKLARDLANSIDRQGATVELVHSRFRPPDRQSAMDRALATPDADGPGIIVVTTQAMEAGVDISSHTLVTQTAPWSSVVQRAGRCNRYAEVIDARLHWFHSTDTAPYDATDVEASADALHGLEGAALTGQQLAAQAVEETSVQHDVLRRKDLVELFDTTPDLSGNDIDISPFIRDADERDVYIAWRDQVPTVEVPAVDPLSQHELCPTPIAEVRAWIKGGRAVYWQDPQTSDWRVLRSEHLRPGLMLLAASQAGGYTTRFGWDPSSKADVQPVPSEEGQPDGGVGPDTIGEDPLSFGRHWVTLSDHQRDAGVRAREVLDALRPAASDAVMKAVVRAAELHDIGKVHDCFQAMLRGSAGAEEMASETMIWAKSSRRRQSANARPAFRHELLSALLLMGEGADLIGEGVDHDLVRYLVAAHHGIVRLGLRASERDRTDEEVREILGIREGETQAPVMIDADLTVGGGPFALSTLAAFGGEGSWTRSALALRDDPDIGVFRLGQLEALVRLADWMASAAPSTVRTADGTEVPRG